jgi:hypothetical protein
MMNNDKLRIIVLGYIVRGPLGGMVMSNLQYILGMAKLGHDVYFVEDSGEYESCYSPNIQQMTSDPAYGLRFAQACFDWIGLPNRWAYYDWHTRRWHGPAADHIVGVCRSADVVLNLCGVNPLRDWLLEAPCRILVDEDPVFTHVRHLRDEAARAEARKHTAFFSFGANIEAGLSSVPDDGFPWRATRPPIALDNWPALPPKNGGRFTTVMQWGSYMCARWEGRTFGMKREIFPPYADLPRHVVPDLEMAIGGLPEQMRQEMQDSGWTVIDPEQLSRTPQAYQQYIQGSRGEFSIAKHGYVVSNSGWFSERSACYLASGRPVIVQDTGFTSWLPEGSGLATFSTPQQAAQALNCIDADYERHCSAARELADAYFESGKVLASLLVCAHQSLQHSCPSRDLSNFQE